MKTIIYPSKEIASEEYARKMRCSTVGDSAKKGVTKEGIGWSVITRLGDDLVGAKVIETDDIYGLWALEFTREDLLAMIEKLDEEPK